MKIVRVPDWLGTKHYLLEDDGKLVCTTHSMFVVNFWIRKYRL